MPEDNSSPLEVEVVVVVNDQQIACAVGKPLLNALLNAGLLVRTACGGQGACRLCRVRVLPGSALPPVPTAVEERALAPGLLAQGVRLSCQVAVRAPLIVRLLDAGSVDSVDAASQSPTAALPKGPGVKSS